MRPTPALPMLPTGGRRTPFVGRQRELDVLCERLEAASKGEGGMVLLGGEPGVGKSRLMLEAAAHAASQGWRLLLGHAYDTEGMPPYLPFSEALQDYVRLCPIEELKAQLGDDASAVAVLLREVKRRLPDLPAAVPLDGTSERYRLFESISEFLLSIARAAPAGLLLCLDDLHWADDSTLLLLEHLARRLTGVPLLILATYRDTDLGAARPLARTLAQLTGQHTSRRLDIKPLGKDEVGSMLVALGKPGPPAPLVDAVYNETEGNPFFVEEVFEYLAEEGRLLDSGAGWRADIVISDADVPQGVRLTISRRLERLSENCRRVLSCASVLGRTIDHELLRSLAEMDEEPLLDALDEAERLRLLAGDAHGRLAFTHELIRQTLLNDQSLPRRQRLHLRAAEAIESAHTGNVEQYLPALASHYHLAGAAADAAKAVDYATRAGDQACGVSAYEEALRLYGVALEVLELRGAGPSREAISADLHARRGEAMLNLGMWREARPEFERALEALSGERRAGVLIDLAEASVWGFLDMSSARRYATEACELARARERNDLVAAALAVLAECVVDDGEVRRGIEQYRQAASTAGDLRSVMHRRVLQVVPLALYWTGQLEESLQRGRAAVEAAREARDIVNLVGALPRLGLAVAATGRYTEAARLFAEARQAARQYGARGLQVPLSIAIEMSAGFHIDTFDLAGGETLAEEAEELVRSSDWWLQTAVSAGIDKLLIFARRQEVGRAEDLIGEVARQVERAQGRHGWLWRLRLAEARAEIALARGDWQEALRCSSDAIEQSRVTGRVKYEAMAMSTRGKALVALGRKREAIIDLRQAVEVARPVGDPAMLVRAAAALLAVDGDDALAAGARQAADRILDNLPDEMKGIFAAAEPVQLIFKLTGAKASRPGPARPGYPAGLSERQVQVLRLVALGKTNREIAGELVLSERTVQRHVADVYAKIEARNRAEATAFALERLRNG